MNTYFLQYLSPVYFSSSSLITKEPASPAGTTVNTYAGLPASSLAPSNLLSTLQAEWFSEVPVWSRMSHSPQNSSSWDKE